MKLVLDSTIEVTDFGVIFNKISNGVMRKFEQAPAEKQQMMNQICQGLQKNGGRKSKPHPLYLKKFPGKPAFES